MIRLPNIQKRSNGVYYLRVYIPTELVSRFARKEITRSLGTKRQKEAERAAIILRSVFLRIVQMAKANPTLSLQDLKAMANRYFDWALTEAKREHLEARVAPKDREKMLASHAEMISIIKQWRTDLKNNPDAKILGSEFVNELLKLEGIELDNSSHQYRLLADLAMSSQARIHRLQYDWVNGTVSPQDDEEQERSNLPADKIDLAKEGLNEVAEKFQSEHAAIWKPKTQQKYKANLSVCLAVLGQDTKVGALQKSDIRELKETLEKLPSNWSKKLPGRSITQVAAEATPDDGPTISPGSVNAYLGTLSSLFNWATRFGYSDDNPVAGIRAIDPIRPEDKRHPFSAPQLNSIFSAPIYTGMRSEREWHKPGNMVLRNDRFWLPLAALFTGMRLSEILNLHTQDFISTESIEAIDIREAKTTAGQRKVPIHPTLIRCGLLNYVGSLDEGSAVFARFSQKAYSKFFRRFQESLNFDDPKLVFHSFRHNFTDALRSANVEQTVAKALLGHSEGTVTARYGSGYPLEVLDDAIKRVEYRSLDLSRLYD